MDLKLTQKPKQPVCCILNFPSHYRKEIYKKMENELNAHFYFGNIDDNKIKKIDFDNFKNKIASLQTIRIFGQFNWIKNTVRLSFKNYSVYIITGEPYCISSWFILILNSILRKRTYTWTHGWYGSERGLRKLIKWVYFQLPTGNFLYGHRAKELMHNEGFNAKNQIVIYNSLNYEEQLEIRHKLTKNNIYTNYFNNSYPVLIYSGRLNPVKKIDFLLKAVSELIVEGVHCNLFIIGEGPERDTLEKQAKNDRNLKGGVYFYGSCYDENKIGDFFYNAQCCVSPGNVGLTGVHAMTYGCPVITHDNFSEQMPEYEVVIPGLTGEFFIQNSIEDLKLKIKKVLVKSDYMEKCCFSVIDEKYNTRTQMEIFKEIL